MTEQAALLAEIYQWPEEDAPRMIFADWLEDNGDPERAEFIRLQLQQARGDSGEEPTTRGRAAVLLAKHWKQWVAPLARLISGDGYEPHMPWLREKPEMALTKLLSHFPRGFVGELSMAVDRMLNHAEEILQRTVLTRLRLYGVGGKGRQLAGCPALRWIRELEFIDYYRQFIGPEDMAELAQSPYLGRLKTLRLARNNLGDEGVRALTEAGWLEGIEYLDLSDNGISTEGLAALIDCPRFRSLRVLHLDHNFFSDFGDRLLERSNWLGQLKFLSMRRSQLAADVYSTMRNQAPHLVLRID